MLQSSRTCHLHVIGHVCVPAGCSGVATGRATRLLQQPINRSICRTLAAAAHQTPPDINRLYTTQEMQQPFMGPVQAVRLKGQEPLEISWQKGRMCGAPIVKTHACDMQAYAYHSQVLFGLSMRNSRCNSVSGQTVFWMLGSSSCCGQGPQTWTGVTVESATTHTDICNPSYDLTFHHAGVGFFVHICAYCPPQPLGPSGPTVVCIIINIQHYLGIHLLP
jgi:hypothetical protein